MWRKGNTKQITMTNPPGADQNNWLLILFEIWNLFGPILRSGGACNLLFPVYPVLGPYLITFGVTKSENFKIEH